MSGAVFFTLSVAVLLVALRLYQANLTAIMGWPHGEMQPDGAMLILGRAKRRSRAALNQQFIKVLRCIVADVEQDSRIAYQLFHILHPVMQACWDAAGEVIKAWATEGHSVALPGLGTMRFGLRAKSVEKVDEVKAGLITSRRIIFTPAVELKDELAGTAIQITCYDRDGKEVKRVTSTDSGDIEDPENTSGGENQNQGGNTGGNGGSNTGGNQGGGDYPGEGD